MLRVAPTNFTQATLNFRAQSALVQAAIKAQHATLYRSRILRTKANKGLLPDGESLLTLLNGGKDQNGDLAFFTYVIDLNGRWCFSRTGRAAGADLLSKHVVHNKGKTELLYAGEFHIQDNGTLIMDNNSGTYAPDPAQLPILTAVMRASFVGLNVDSWAQSDPRLKFAIARSPTRKED